MQFFIVAVLYLLIRFLKYVISFVFCLKTLDPYIRPWASSSESEKKRHTGELISKPAKGRCSANTKKDESALG